MHGLQDQITAVPLSSFGTPYTPTPGAVDPTVDMTTAVREQVNGLSGESYFTVLADLLRTNPPVAADAPLIDTLAALGIVAGQSLDVDSLDPQVREAIAAAPGPAQRMIMSGADDAVAAGTLAYAQRLAVFDPSR